MRGVSSSFAENLTPQSMDGKILANLLVAANGATTQGGRSAPLSPPDDRRRFHAIRSRQRRSLLAETLFVMNHIHALQSRSMLQQVIHHLIHHLIQHIKSQAQRLFDAFLIKRPQKLSIAPLPSKGHQSWSKAACVFLQRSLRRRSLIPST